MPGPQGPAGAGTVLSRTASAIIPAWSAVVLDASNYCLPADPANPAHSGAVVGVCAAGAASGGAAAIQTIGDAAGPVGSWTAGDQLYVGASGVLSSTPPSSGWVLLVGKAVTTSRVIVNMGAVTASSLVGPDANYLIPVTATHVTVPALTASRAWRLPDVDGYPPGRDLVVADEGDSLSDTIVLNILPLDGSGDTIRGTTDNVVSLRAPGAFVRFRRGILSNTWMIV
ncbi:hypothetical protein [Methylobacterium oryzisoli]|uniref:hypothetical protein n=1 Tax=Methylobacterium oryzisoli TaxID=3385502 RepID=UPI003978EACE